MTICADALNRFGEFNVNTNTNTDSNPNRFGEFWKEADAAKASTARLLGGAGAKAAAPPPAAP